jgi:hypothetical protein
MWIDGLLLFALLVPLLCWQGTRPGNQARRTPDGAPDRIPDRTSTASPREAMPAAHPHPTPAP